MGLRIREGKRNGLKAVADERGVIAALAIDQRSALRKLFANAMNVEPEGVPADKLIQLKEAVSRILTLHASAILLAPEYGLPAARQRAKTAGLLLAHEKTGCQRNLPGRLPELLDHWTAGRLLAASASAVKILLTTRVRICQKLITGSTRSWSAWERSASKQIFSSSSSW